MKVNYDVYLDWVKLAARTVDASGNQECLSCGYDGLEIRFFRFNDSDIGYLWLTCPKCLKGIHISRVKIPPSELGTHDTEETSALYKVVDWIEPDDR